MAETIEIKCPACGSGCNPLIMNCKSCGSRVVEYIALQRRVEALEKAAGISMNSSKWVESIRLFSVLLEYRPQQPRYLKGLASACLKIGEQEHAREILEELGGRFKNDAELEVLRSQLNELKERGAI